MVDLPNPDDVPVITHIFFPANLSCSPVSCLNVGKEGSLICNDRKKGDGQRDETSDKQRANHDSARIGFDAGETSHISEWCKT